MGRGFPDPRNKVPRAVIDKLKALQVGEVYSVSADLDCKMISNVEAILRKIMLTHGYMYRIEREEDDRWRTLHVLRSA